MSEILLWILHLALSLAAFAAALAWAQGVSSRALRGLLVALGLLPLAAAAYATWSALYLRFGLGIGHSPWIYATSLLAAGTAGAFLLWRRRGAAATWSPAGATAAALGFLVAETVLLSNLHTAALQRASELRFEAGRIAFDALPPKPAREENAAPVLEEAIELVHAAAPTDVWQRWRDELLDEVPPDVGGPDVESLLEAAAPALARAHDAAALARMQPEREGDALEWIAPSYVIGLVDLETALRLRARVRAKHGDFAGAFDDLAASRRIADHLLDTPALISVMVAAVFSDRVNEALMRLLEVDPARAAEIAAPARDAIDALLLALRLEEAYALNALGRLGEPGVELRPRTAQSISPATHLGMIFLLDEEVRAYRSTLAELREEVAEGRAPEPLADEELRARGIAVRFLVPRIHDMALSVRRAEARTSLVRAAALALATVRSGGASGYPTSVAELGGESAAKLADVRLEPLPGGGLRLTHAAFPPEAEERDEERLEIVLDPPWNR